MSGGELPATLPLAWLIDEHWGKAYPIADRASIGRGAENKIILRDQSVSRLHAEITRDGDRYVLRSLGSSATRINGTTVAAPHELAEGDLIEIAFSELRFTRKSPTADLLVVARDSLAPTDALEAPTGVGMRAAESTKAVGNLVRRILRRLTRRSNTD